MSSLSKHHEELTDGVGRCSVPMWQAGCPAGFCDDPAYGKQTAEYRNRFRGMDPRYHQPAYASGLACPGHGGPSAPLGGLPL